MADLEHKPGSCNSSASTFRSEATIPTNPFIRRLMGSSIILPEDWKKLPNSTQNELQNCTDARRLLELLVEKELLTDYQANCVDVGRTFGLVLGNYRVLDRIGEGGMGVVFKGEHLRMRRLVAIKVMPGSTGLDYLAHERFLSEIRVVAQLQHPNIVAAIDAGEIAGNGESAFIHYFVMEYVEGQDLEQKVCNEGPLRPEQACGLIYQIAGALAEAHKHHLVHRDIKPSNIRVTPNFQAKLLDFGLVREFENRLTNPGTILGSLDYLSPEQARDSSCVDIRTDIYGLGGTLYWCLTGQVPFSTDGSLHERLLRRLSQSPPAIRNQKADVPAALEAVISHMMATDPDDRYATPQHVMNALLRFLQPDSQELLIHPRKEPGPQAEASSDDAQAQGQGARRILIVDDSPTVQKFCAETLQEEGLICDTVANGCDALVAVEARKYDIVLSDWNMPEMSGLELCQQLRLHLPSANLKVILFSADLTDDDVAEALAVGADDYLTKSFSPVQLIARVKASLRLKESQDRAQMLNRNLAFCNQQLTQNLSDQGSHSTNLRNALIMTLADLVSCRDLETITHTVRLQRYCRCLAEEAFSLPAFDGLIDGDFVENLECCAPLHDIGKAGLPDHVLLKAGNLDAEERLIMQSHTTIGAETLQKLAQRHGSAVAFLQMAIDIARSHHERYDGKGYPDRLAGNAIPLAARLVAVADSYDGLRCRRAYKPALTHSAAIQSMLEGSGSQFDPTLIDLLKRCSPRFEQVFRELPD